MPDCWSSHSQMKEQEPTFVALAKLTSLKLSYQKYNLTLIPNVGQLLLICMWNSFAINTVKLKQRSTKWKTKTEQNAVALHIHFSKPNVTKLLPPTVCMYMSIYVLLCCMYCALRHSEWVDQRIEVMVCKSSTALQTTFDLTIKHTCNQGSALQHTCNQVVKNS